ncbi:MAG: hypothetical protein KGH69_01020 [Candidatus Micrarchaeota archaeon]|nr:hypothetical protein [Candidatus Micrarchaeota archaeon]
MPGHVVTARSGRNGESHDLKVLVLGRHPAEEVPGIVKTHCGRLPTVNELLQLVRDGALKGGIYWTEDPQAGKPLAACLCNRLSRSVVNTQQIDRYESLVNHSGGAHLAVILSEEQITAGHAKRARRE